MGLPKELPRSRDFQFLMVLICLTLTTTYRIQIVVVQLMHVPVRIINLYLKPGSCESSRRLNGRLTQLAASVACSTHGPCMITGDLNHPISDLGPLNQLLNVGWMDAALHCALVDGVEAPPTCMQASRHTVQLVNPHLFRFLRSSEVLPFEAFHKHDFLVCSYDVPFLIPEVFQWSQPKKMDDLMFDKVSLEQHGQDAPLTYEQGVVQALHQRDEDKALKLWAEAAESVFSKSCCNEEGFRRKMSEAHFGRCQNQQPTKVRAFEPRYKQGRPGDDKLPFDTPTLRARSFLKQARRLQNIIWGAKKLDEVFQDNLVIQMQSQWNAVIHASGLGMPFWKWIANQGFPYFPSDFYDFPWLEQVHQCVLDEAHRLSRKAWNHKQQKFKQRLRSSFSERGGRDAFQRIKKESFPEVNVLFKKVALDLMLQDWEGNGRENLFGFAIPMNFNRMTVFRYTQA